MMNKKREDLAREEMRSKIYDARAELRNGISGLCSDAHKGGFLGIEHICGILEEVKASLIIRKAYDIMNIADGQGRI